MRVRRWDEGRLGPLNEEAAQKRFHPALYEVAVREVAPATRVSGEAPQRTLIALEGRWVLEADGQRTFVQPGDMVEVSSGKFTFETSEPVRYVAAYPLPPEKVLN
ncbi:MAG: hypothetical protein QM765_40485 [Myxococcales bacterium]